MTFCLWKMMFFYLQKVISKKIVGKIFFLAFWRSLTKIAGSGSIPKYHGSATPGLDTWVRIFVAAPSLMEVQSTVAVEGHAWAMQEVTPATRLADLFRNSCGGRTPPAAVMQHAAAPRQLVVLSAQGANMNAFLENPRQEVFYFPMSSFFLLQGGGFASLSCGSGSSFSLKCVCVCVSGSKLCEFATTGLQNI